MIRAADPEDVIGLKVQAMVNDPDRKPQDLSYIEMLVRLYGEILDWQRVEDFYDTFGLKDEADRLKQRFGHA